ncbi:uncharacterized protein LOC143280862 [Babylonia areolata]|uniref:uncharacterized protein LOC143280862 n=1 Tax=Babylonia areolata TaxID=304850 RepID=UPI003FD49079
MEGGGQDTTAISSTSCEERNSEPSAMASISGTVPPAPEGEEQTKGCRKSSRLKAKMSRQEAKGEESGDAYNLRLSSLVKRVQVERRQSTPKQPKGKTKPPPLSKYRRRTANARERMRMKEINDGFERLREALPEMEEAKGQGKKKEKPTKLTVLNLALNYIHALRDILGYPALSDGTGGGVASGHSEESDLCSDAASTRTLSSSSASCDEICSNPSPDSSVLDMKEFALSDASSLLTSALPKDLTTCHTPAAPSLMDFRMEARSSPSSSDLSLSPTPPPLPLPEEYMEIVKSDLLDESMSLSEWDIIL